MNLDVVVRLVNDVDLQQKAVLDCFETLKSDPNGWRLCADRLVVDSFSNDHAIFFCFQVIEHFVVKNYGLVSGDEKDRAALHQLIYALFEKEGYPTAYLNNKFAQLVNQIFLVDYPQQKWNDFFKDLLARCINGKRCDTFLRILSQLNTDLADVEISKTNVELSRNTFIKDYMRETCVFDLANFWYNIINNCQEYPPQTVCLCLDVIGSYSSWIDINLITNDNFMLALFATFTNPTFQCSVIDCFGSILRKGMDPFAKLQIIENFLKIDSIKESLNAIFSAKNLNIEFIRKFSNLINTIGVELIDAYKKLREKSTPATSVEVKSGLSIISNSIESKFVLMCQFLSFADLETSFKVHSFVRDYIQWIKLHLKEDASFFQQSIEDKTVLLLSVFVEKCKIPTCASVEEEFFDEVRKSLKNLFDNLMLLNSKTVIIFLCDKVISPVLANWKVNTLPFVEIEVALYYLNKMGETMNALADIKQFEDTVRMLVESSVSSYANNKTQVHYFRIVLRYEKFYNSNLSHLFPQILASFLDERGLRNPSTEVRNKVTRLFKNFIKASYSKTKTTNQEKHRFTEEILKQLQDFLKLDVVFDDPSYLEECNLDDYINSQFVIRQESVKFPFAISNLDQLHIYETIVYLLISSPFFEMNRKQELLKCLLQEIWQYFNILHQELAAVSSEIGQNGFLNSTQKSVLLEKQLFAALHLCHPINLVAASTKAFSNMSTISSYSIGNLYLQSFEIFMKTIELKLKPEATFVLQSSIRRYLHRLIVCMSEEEMTPLLPDAIKALFLSGDDISVKSLQELIPLLQQILSKYNNKQLHPFLLQMFVPLLQVFHKRIIESSNEPEKLALQKCYYFYLHFMICGSQLMTDFYLLDTSLIEQVFYLLMQGPLCSIEPNSKRMSLQVALKLFALYEMFMRNNSNHSTVVFMNQFIYRNLLNSLFVCLMKNFQDFNLVYDSLLCIRGVRTLFGDSLDDFMLSDYFPGHFPTTNKQELFEVVFVQDAHKSKKMFVKLSKLFKAD